MIGEEAELPGLSQRGGDVIPEQEAAAQAQDEAQSAERNEVLPVVTGDQDRGPGLLGIVMNVNR